MPQPKPQIHWSKIRSKLRCGEAFRRAERGEFIPPTKALIKGSGSHEGIGADLQNKIDTGELLALNQVQDATRDSVNRIWSEQGCRLVREEKTIGEKAVKGETVDGAVRLVSAYHNERAPGLNPRQIERPWVVELEGYPFDVAGTIDYDEPETLLDWKTGAKTPPAHRADRSIQLSMYAMAKMVIDKLPEVKAAFHFLIDLKTGPKIIPQETIRTPRHTRTALGYIEQFILSEEKGIYLPTDPENWWCAPEY